MRARLFGFFALLLMNTGAFAQLAPDGTDLPFPPDDHGHGAAGASVAAPAPPESIPPPEIMLPPEPAGTQHHRHEPKPQHRPAGRVPDAAPPAAGAPPR